MNKFLLFRIYAPIVSWGCVEAGQENRGSDNYPTKTAILGIICAALGIKRHEEEKIIDLNNNLGYSVKVISDGKLLTDYHTTQVNAKLESRKVLRRSLELTTAKNTDKLETILSSRDHRMEAQYYVAIWLKGNSKITLEDIASALKEPVFAPYFGRKACPSAAPLEPNILNTDTLKEAFNKVQFSPICYDKNGGKAYIDNSLFPKKLTKVYWENGVNSGYDADMQIERYDSLVSRKRWQFKARTEFVALISEGDD